MVARVRPRDNKCEFMGEIMECRQRDFFYVEYNISISIIHTPCSYTTISITHTPCYAAYQIDDRCDRMKDILLYCSLDIKNKDIGFSDPISLVGMGKLFIRYLLRSAIDTADD